MVIELLDVVEMEFLVNNDLMGVRLVTRDGGELTIHQPFDVQLPSPEEKNNMTPGREYTLKIFFEDGPDGNVRCVHIAKYPL